MALRTVNAPIIHRDAAFLPATVDAAARTVEMVWSTGAQVRRWDWMDGEYLEELDMSEKAVDLSRLNNGAPFLADHRADLANTIGVVERAWIDAKEGRAVVRFAEGDELAEAVWRKVQQGIVRNISVGYRVEKFMETKESGGKRVLRAVKWTPLELSAVAVPADAGAGFRSNVDAAPCEIERDGDSEGNRGMDPNQKPGDPAAPAPVPVDGGEANRSAPNTPGPDAIAAARAEGIAHAVSIIELVELGGGNVRKAAEYISSGKSVDVIRSELLAARASNGAPPVDGNHQPVGADAPAGAMAARMAARYQNQKGA